jgi:hypothetical protein
MNVSRRSTRLMLLVSSLLAIACLSPQAFAAEHAGASYPGLKPDEFLKSWLVLGPIAGGDDKAFFADFLAEHGGEAGVEPKAGQAYTLGAQELRWQEINSTSDHVDLTAIFGNKNFVVAYAWAHITMPEQQRVLTSPISEFGLYSCGVLVHPL